MHIKRLSSVAVLISMFCIAGFSVFGQPPNPTIGSASRTAGEVLTQTDRTNFNFAYEGACEAASSNIETASASRPKIDDRIIGAQRLWLELSVSWKHMYWAALVCSLVLSTLVATSFLKDYPRLMLKSFAGFGSALSAAFLATFNPQIQAERYLRGHIYMQTAMVHYETNPTMSTCQLAQAYARAEVMVHSGSSSIVSTPTR